MHTTLNLINSHDYLLRPIILWMDKHSCKIKVKYDQAQCTYLLVHQGIGDSQLHPMDG